MKVRDYRVYYIDPEEDIKDLIDLIKRSRTKKLALVVHNRLLLLNSPINLKLIKEYSDKYRKEIVFINPDPVINEKVSKAGFPIYPDLDHLEKNLSLAEEAAISEEEKGQNAEKGDKKTGIILTLLFTLLTLILAYFYFFYPTATIELEPIVKYARQDLVLKASTNLSKIDWENNMLPLYQMEVDITDSAETKTTGVKLIGETRATGVIRIINEKQQEVTLPPGTVVQTADGVRFRTTEKVVVPKLEVDYLMNVPVGMKAGQAEVKIEAIKPGRVGNVNIGRINKMVEPIEQVHVINPEPTRGGEDKRISIVTGKDRKILEEELKENLKSELVTKLYKELGGNYRIVEEAITYDEPVISYSHQPGEETSILKAEGTLTANVYFLRNNELDRLVTRNFEKNLQENYRLFSSGVNIENILLEEIDSKLYNIKIELLAPVIPAINTENLVRELQGKDLQTVSKILEQREEIDRYRIQAKTKKLPRFSFAIDVVVSEPDTVQVFQVNDS